MLGVSQQTKDLWRLAEGSAWGYYNYKEAKRCVDYGAAINASNVFGKTALHLAAVEGNTDAVRFLLNEGARLRMKDCEGKTPLHYAAERKEGRQLISCALIRAGAAVDVVDDDGCAPLHNFVKNNQKNVLEYLLKDRFLSRHIKINVDVKDSDGMTALHYAAKVGNKRVCSLLLGAGADGNAKDENGMTAMHYAAKCKNQEIAYLLMDRGASVKKKDNKGKTALHYAAKEGNEMVIEELLKKKASVLVNVKDTNGMTALHYASRGGHEGVVALLLNVTTRKGYPVGQDGINIKNKDGMTALMFATEGGYWRIVRKLLVWEARVNVQDSDGWSALHHALGTIVDSGGDSVNLIRIVAELKKFGANVELKNNDGETPYDFRVQRSQRDGR